MGCCGDDDDGDGGSPLPSLAALPSDLLEPLNACLRYRAHGAANDSTISPMNSNFSALLCEDTLQTILEKLSLPDLARSACVCRLWRSVASDRDIQIRAFMSPWKLRDVIGKPSSGGFWRDNSISRFAVSHRISRGDSVASLAVKYSVQVNRKLELWKDTLESKDFRLSRTKTEYMTCAFSIATHDDGDVSLDGQVVAKKETFRYLGSMLQKDGGINVDDGDSPGDAECWPTKRKHVQQLSVAEMRMLRWFCGHTSDRIRNENIRDRVGVAPIEEKLVQHRLRWFGHVQRRPPDAPVRRGVLQRVDDPTPTCFGLKDYVVVVVWFMGTFSLNSRGFYLYVPTDQVMDIKRLNNMMSDHGIYSRERLLIPVSKPEILVDSTCYIEVDTQSKREVAVLYLDGGPGPDRNVSGLLSGLSTERGKKRVLDSLRRSMQVDDGTAQYYLSISNGDPRAALTRFSEDLRWERHVGLA
ncbi:F-box protein At1g55000 [Striga asiatica]|uniref:F-box protein At1g55000 n=1 Tax=Striga asiatica TaxID=4170 RepID=A0A5A7RCR9_STRAF|nr:F-box protein At1g55000 [Striga asiatica]